jgi:hypothetical protein
LYNLDKAVLAVDLDSRSEAMDALLPKLDRAALRAQLLAEFERTVEKVADAVDNAPAGRVIRDSEEPARVALDRFRCKVYEAALQVKVEAAEAAFPPSGHSDGPPAAS